MTAGRSPAHARSWTAGDLIREGARRFRHARLAFGHGTSSAIDEAAWLVLHALGLPPGANSRVLSCAVAPPVAKRIMRLFDRRVRERKPAAYLIREAWLGDLRFYVDERTIIPRSHIAALLREALFPWIRRPGNIREVLDLCTGSGALAVLAAFAFPNARIDAADISGPALEVARRNVRAYRLPRRVRVIRSDLYSSLQGKHYDLVLCNPPYVTSNSMRRLPGEYRHEPRLALAGGADGLDVVRRILAESAAHLKPKGLLVVEVGAGRRRVEHDFPDIRFIWPESVAGSAVFLLERDEFSRSHPDNSRLTR